MAQNQMDEGMRGKIALAGGGDEHDSYLVDKAFASWIGERGRLLYLPVAQRGQAIHQAGLAWLTRTFAPFKVTNIVMWPDLNSHQPAELLGYDAVYIGGGNTYDLLSQLIESGFDHDLRNYVLAGGVVYGGSAGAVVLGRDIQTVRHLDANDVGLTSLGGLDLVGGYAVWVHYRDGDDARIAAYIQETEHPVLALTERSGLVITQDGMRSVGFEPVYRFDGTGKRERLGASVII